MPEWVDFREVKSRADILRVLRRYGVELRKVNATTFRGNCPLPQHQSPTKSSFAVDARKNVWSCKSDSCKENRKGKVGGNVLDFVAWYEKVSLREAALLLNAWFSSPPPQVVAEQVDEAAPNPPLAFQLKDIQFVHPYLTARGFEEEECEYLGVGFFPGKGSMMGRVVFPIHNDKGELVAYAGRSTTDTEPRWLFPKGFHRGQELYNLHRVEGAEVIVVESFWGVMACIRAGILNAVALMGNQATDEQVKKLCRFERIQIMLDGDKAGREGAAHLLDHLVKRNIPRLEVILLEGQPDDKEPDQLRRAVGCGDVAEVPVMLTSVGQSWLEGVRSDAS